MELTVEKRDSKKSSATLRGKGILPAVIYGRKEESTPIAVDRKTFEKLYKQAGENTVVTIKGLGEDKDTLIHEVVVDAVTGVALHADFYAIAKGQTVTVAIPIEFDGESPAVKELGGILVKVMHELEIEVPPKDLPHALHADISKLKTLEDKITVADLKLPASAKITADVEEVVAMIDVAKDEPVEEAAMDITQIEMSVEKGKKEEEGAEGEAAESKE
jgi:large subunit ribosomal protein L25